MARRLYIGIDPGLKGAVAFMRGKAKQIFLEDIPTIKVGKKNEYDVRACAALIHKHVTFTNLEVFVALERQWARQKQGLSSTFKTGVGYGLWLGILAAEGLAFEDVTPQRWQKVFGLTGKDKEASRLRALQLFPRVADQMARKMDADRAEALLMAEYIRRL